MAQETRLWGLDICQNAVFSPAIRETADFPEPDGPGSDGFEPGFFELQSTHPIRAVERVDPGDDEVCALHFGKMNMGDDGFARPVFCSLPITVDGRDDDQHSQTTVLVPFSNDRDETWQGVEPGFFAFLGACHAPWWTDVIFRSKVVICGAPI